MRIDIITVLPEMLEGFFNESILARAQKKGLAEIHLHNLRDYTLDKWKRVDDYPYGGSAGMVNLSTVASLPSKQNENMMTSSMFLLTARLSTRKSPTRCRCRATSSSSAAITRASTSEFATISSLVRFR